MSRIVITSCSKCKIDKPNLVSAIDRYDGPSFRLLRKYLRQPADDIDIFILSAKFGLVSHQTQLPYYEQKLDKFHAEDLGILASSQALPLFADSSGATEIFVNLGKTYFEAFQPTLHQISVDISLTIASGTSGRRLSELHDWLYGEKSRLLADMQSSFPEQEVLFKGVIIRANEEDIRLLIRKGIANGEAELIQNFQSWFVSIDDLKVSPKWLVSKLTGIAVGKFHSDQARSVLRKLGIEIHRV